MSLVPEIVTIALRVKPDQATLVPERRQEVTTEGGIDLDREGTRATDAVRRLHDAGVFVSAFIDPQEKQVILAAQQGFDAVELHTGDFSNAASVALAREQLERLQSAGILARQRNLRLHAGHGLNYRNVAPVARLSDMAELNIGHAILSRALFVGLRQAVVEMKQAIAAARSPGFASTSSAETRA
jgi:pyridoxine 5-phosphate synthase